MRTCVRGGSGEPGAVRLDSDGLGSASRVQSAIACRCQCPARCQVQRTTPHHNLTPAAPCTHVRECGVSRCNRPRVLVGCANASHDDRVPAPHSSQGSMLVAGRGSSCQAFLPDRHTVRPLGQRLLECIILQRFAMQSTWMVCVCVLSVFCVVVEPSGCYFSPPNAPKRDELSPA
jgi:hypothetical protein